METGELTDKIRAIVEESIGDGPVELVHVEIAGTKRDRVVRIFIDKPEGVGIDDCTNVSREVEAVLDEKDLIPSKYVLEVSSPGIERELYSILDFVKFKGDLVKVKINGADGAKQTLVGNISNVEENTITIDDRSLGSVAFEFSDVIKANLKIDLAKEFGR